MQKNNYFKNYFINIKIGKKLFFGIVFCFTFLLFSNSAQAAALSFSPSSKAVDVGDIINVSVYLNTANQAVNSLIPWSNITIFFGMIRQWSSLIDFIFPTDTLWQIVGLVFSVYPFLWSIMAIKILINNSGLRE